MIIIDVVQQHRCSTTTLYWC